ncbi:MAG: glycosyltransferase family 39 protein [Acetobacteraceae bacterium]|nr:glycosyltransferase family 39 protein [Acetobacteraceae bacterium]
MTAAIDPEVSTRRRATGGLRGYPIVGPGWSIVLAGALLRLVYLLVHPPDAHIYSDMLGYVIRAHGLATGAPLIRYDAFYPPGAHVLLAAPLWLFGPGHGGLVAAGWLWWLLSSLVPLATWRLARQLVSPAAALLAAALSAADPLLIAYGGFFTSEIPATAALLGALWLGVAAGRRSGRGSMLLGLAAGLLAGAAIVTRPQLALNIVVLLFAMRQRHAHRRTLAALLCAAIGVTGAGVAYTSAAAGHLTTLAENGGMNFFQSHCDVHVVRVTVSPGQDYVFGAPAAVMQNRGADYVYRGVQPGDQSFFYRQGLHCVSRNVPEAIGIAARNMADLTVTSVPWPPVDETGLGRIVDAANVIYCTFLVVALGLLVRGRRRRSPAVTSWALRLLLAQLACMLPVAIIFGAEPRFRVPYDAFGLILITGAIAGMRGQVETPTVWLRR